MFFNLDNFEVCVDFNSQNSAAGIGGIGILGVEVHTLKCPKVGITDLKCCTIYQFTFNKIFKLLFGDFMDTSDFFCVNAKDLLLQFPECLHIIYFTIQTSFIISWSPIQELSRSNLACLSELSQNWMTIIIALGELVSTIMHFQIVFPRHPLFQEVFCFY